MVLRGFLERAIRPALGLPAADAEIYRPFRLSLHTSGPGMFDEQYDAGGNRWTLEEVPGTPGNSNRAILSRDGRFVASAAEHATAEVGTGNGQARVQARLRVS